jgi:hypothetical protein
MYRVIKQINEDNSTIIATNPAFLAAHNAFKAKLSALITTVTAELQIITGIATDKTTLKKNLAQTTADICNLISAYASATNNNTLLAAVSFPYSDIVRIKDDKIHEFCQNIYGLASTNATALVPYGITTGMLSAFQQAITDYATIVPKPKSAKAAKAAYTKSIKTQMKDIDDLLKKQLDKLLTAFKATKSDFYNTFRAGRVIIDPSTTVTQIKGKITDSFTKTPIPGVSVEITGPKNYSVKTNVRGIFTQKPMDNGLYNININIPNYQPVTVNDYTAKLGKINKLNITLTSL